MVKMMAPTSTPASVAVGALMPRSRGHLRDRLAGLPDQSDRTPHGNPDRTSYASLPSPSSLRRCVHVTRRGPVVRFSGFAVASGCGVGSRNAQRVLAESRAMCHCPECRLHRSLWEVVPATWQTGGVCCCPGRSVSRLSEMEGPTRVKVSSRLIARRRQRPVQLMGSGRPALVPLPIDLDSSGIDPSSSGEAGLA
jgi:hypothetical protein